MRPDSSNIPLAAIDDGEERRENGTVVILTHRLEAVVLAVDAASSVAKLMGDFEKCWLLTAPGVQLDSMLFDHRILLDSVTNLSRETKQGDLRFDVKPVHGQLEARHLSRQDSTLWLMYVRNTC